MRMMVTALAAAAILGMTGKECESKMRVKREGNQVFVDGLQKESWGCGGKENSVFGAMEAALKSMGEDLSYEYLMGISGSAFRLQVSQPKGWCPSSPHACLGANCADVALKHLELRFRRIADVKPDDAGVMAAMKKAVVASIDAGIVVFPAEEESSLIVGYVDGGDKFLYRKYCHGEPGYAVVEEWPWWLDVLERTGEERKSRREIAVASLRRALDLADTEKVPGSAGKIEEDNYYAAGWNAWDLWIKGLRDPKSVDGLKGDAWNANMMGNGHIYYSLVDARGSAATYLKGVAGEFSGEPADRLRAAAAIYEEMVEKVMAKRCPTEVAPMPWMLKEGQKWTQEMRDEQADILAKARDLERKALAEISAALKLIERG